MALSPRQITIFIGNPGTGKSSIVNCYVGECLFKAGLAQDGVGLTFKLDQSHHGNMLFMDTPGLADIAMRRRAAKAIDEALQPGGCFRIVFLMTTEGGRMRPDDLTTMKLVFEAVGDQVPEDSFSIIVNKCSPEFLAKFNRESWIKTLHVACTESKMPKTKHIHFAPVIKDMEDKDNIITSLGAPTIAFLDQLVHIDIDGRRVQDIQAQNFEQIKEEMVALTAALKEAKEEAVREAATRKQSEQLREQAQKEVVAEMQRRQRAEEDAAAERENAIQHAAARQTAEEETAVATEFAKAAAQAKERAEQAQAAADAVAESAKAESERQAAAKQKAEEEAAQAMKAAQSAEAKAEQEATARKMAEEERIQAVAAAELAAKQAQKEATEAQETIARFRKDVVASNLVSIIVEMRETNWLGLTNWYSGYGVAGIIKEMREIDPKKHEQMLQRVFLIEAAKSNTWSKDILLFGLPSSKVGAWRLKDEQGHVVYEGPHASYHFVPGSWIYSINKAGQCDSYTLE